jgi:hypothetical protein
MMRLIRRALPVIPVKLLLGTAIFAPTAASAAEAPTKQVVSARYGSDVNRSKEKANAPQAERNECTVESADECQPGKASGEAGGFNRANGVATYNKDVYVADEDNNRVQKLEANGKFMLTFGGSVNKKGGDICTATEATECQAGVNGSAPGQLSGPRSLAADAGSGKVYVLDFFNSRVDEYTSSGAFVLMIGKGVNETSGGNLCTEKEIESEGVKCRAGQQSPEGSTEAGAFKFAEKAGDLLAVGPTGVLYVADEHRAQEFDSEGEPVGEIRTPLEAISSKPQDRVTAIAVDQNGDIFLVYSVSFVADVVREFDASGQSVEAFEVAAHEPEGSGLELEIGQLAVESDGVLAMGEEERYRIGNIEVKFARGTIYDVEASALRPASEFRDEFVAPLYTERGADIAFSGTELYSVGVNELVAYKDVIAAEPKTGSTLCSSGPTHGSDATFDCQLEGEVNPWSVTDTEAWFEWGATLKLGSETAKQAMCTASCSSTPTVVSAAVNGLAPDTRIYQRAAVYDHDVHPPEDALRGAVRSSLTPTAPPRVLGKPSVSFVHPSSAVLFQELNPENADTTYEFRYAPMSTCASLANSCPGMRETSTEISSAYGEVGTTAEATGLQPATAYRYQLVAVNLNGEHGVNESGSNEIAEGTFTSGPAVVLQAVTGVASAISATGATITGVVDSDGQSATYAFELGIFAGSVTRYGTVFSAQAGASSDPVEERLGLTGLQPGTRYAYRVKLVTGFGSVEGAPETFTTPGLPEVLEASTPLAQLAIPPIAFPKAPVVVKKGALTRKQQLARALNACAKKHKDKRAACRRSARKRFASK